MLEGNAAAAGQTSDFLHESGEREYFELQILCAFDDGKSVGRQGGNGMQNFSYFFHEKVLNIGLPGLLDVLLHVLVDVVDKLVFVLDAKDDPIIHFVHQNLEETIILQIYFLSSLLDLTDSEQDMRHPIFDELRQDTVDELVLRYLEFLFSF